MVVSAPRDLGLCQTWVLVGLEQGHSLNSGQGAGQSGSSLVPAGSQAGEQQGEVATARPQGETLQEALRSVLLGLCWAPCPEHEGYW